jgi:uncharacterized protein YycO
MRRSRCPLVMVPVLILAACGGDDGDGGGTTTSSPDARCDAAPPTGDAVLGAACMGPAGGVLELDDGSTLEVPPGALDEATMLSVTALPSTGGRLTWALEPHNTVFALPVVLTLQLDPEAPPLSILHISQLYEPLDQITEESVVRTLEPVAIDSAAARVSVELDHFSFVEALSAKQDAAYIVYDLPDAQLRPGDILLTLTSPDKVFDPNWKPGHVGMVSWAPRIGQVAKGKAIDAVPTKGVREQAVSEFKLNDLHLYLGARELADYPLEDTERTAAVDWARTQLGKPYSLLEWNLGGSDGDFNCVELVDGAMELAGRELIGDNGAFLATPHDVLQATLPVRRVRGQAGTSVKVPIYGVAWDPSLGHYAASGKFTSKALPAWASITAKTLFGGFAGFEVDAQLPIPQSVGRELEIPLTYTYGGKVIPGWFWDGWQPVGVIEGSLLVRGFGEHWTVDLEPLAVSSSRAYGARFEIPPGSEIRDWYAYDDATGLFPAVPYPGQQMTCELVPPEGTTYGFDCTHEWSLPPDQQTEMTGAPITFVMAWDFTPPEELL